MWDSLNPTERYCTLLETWLVRGHPEIIGERGRGWLGVPDTFHQVQWFVQQIPQKGLQTAGNKDAEDSLRYGPGLHNLALLELFGLVEVRHGPPEQGKGWSIETVERTSWGDALLAALHAGFFGDMGNLLAVESEEKVRFGVLQQALQPYFPDWRENLSVPEWTFREGAHVFKVSLGKIWRRIAIPARLTLRRAVARRPDHDFPFRLRRHVGIRRRPGTGGPGEQDPETGRPENARHPAQAVREASGRLNH